MSAAWKAQHRVYFIESQGWDVKVRPSAAQYRPIGDGNTLTNPLSGAVLSLNKLSTHVQLTIKPYQVEQKIQTTIHHPYHILTVVPTKC